jgi:retron-type reverse transcriptase
MGYVRLTHTYDNIISPENLLEAWREFVRGKRHRKDVQEFENRLMDNIFALHRQLTTKSYRHGSYEAFTISDPKPRDIHKALVRDRLVHHALYRILYPFFDKTFIADSYSCRNGKGVHKANTRFQKFSRQVSCNHTKTCWVLKCDIKKFFASIDHAILLQILKKRIEDQNVLWLLSEIIESFHSTKQGVGLPLGNLTSQLLVNIYMNEFDQFVKHTLKVKHSIRYADDFVVFSLDKSYLEDILLQMRGFLLWELKLCMHPNKVSIETLASGVDFLGWVHFPNHRVLRTSTKRRMFRNLEANGEKEHVVQSYLGMLRHGNGWKFREKIKWLHRIVMYR